MAELAGSTRLQPGTAGNAGLQTGTAAAGREGHVTDHPDGTLGSIDALEAKHRSRWTDSQRFDLQRGGHLALRTRRSLSWLERAHQEYASGDEDVAFILYWIAFNAAYGCESEGDRTQWKSYLRKLVTLDTRKSIGSLLRHRLSEPVRAILRDKYLVDDYWKDANEESGHSDWKEDLERDAAWADPRSADASDLSRLQKLFERLYILRNQLLHGSAKLNSSLNRESVQRAVRIMKCLVPVFLDIMLENKKEQWEPPRYRPGLTEPGRVRS